MKVFCGWYWQAGGCKMATDKLSCLSVEPGWPCCCSMANQGLLDTSFGFGFSSFYGWNCGIWGSRDGSDTDAEGGLAIRGQPCVWCGGGLGCPGQQRVLSTGFSGCKGLIEQPGRSLQKFLQTSFCKSFTCWCERLKHGWNIFLKVFSSSSLVSIKDYQLWKKNIYHVTFVLQIIKHPRNSERMSFWDTLKDKTTSKIHPNSPFFFELISGKKHRGHALTSRRRSVRLTSTWRMGRERCHGMGWG